MKNDDVLIKMKEVESITSLKRVFIYSLIKKKCFPSQIKIGMKCAVWSKNEIQAWIQNLKDSKN